MTRFYILFRNPDGRVGGFLTSGLADIQENEVASWETREEAEFVMNNHILASVCEIVEL